MMRRLLCYLFHRFADAEVHERPTYRWTVILCSCGREWTELD